MATELQRQHHPPGFAAHPYGRSQLGTGQPRFLQGQGHSAQLPPLPTCSQPHLQHAQTNRAGPHSNLTHSLQRQAAGCSQAGVVAGTAVGGPVLAPAAAPVTQLGGCPARPTATNGGTWQGYAQTVQAQQALVPSACGLPGAGAPQTAVAPWPTLQPHAGSYQLFQNQGAVHPAAAAAVHPAAVLAATGQPAVAADTRRARRRRPTARRSLLNLFDAVAATDDPSEPSEDSDSDVDMLLASQDSAESTLTIAASPCTPCARAFSPAHNAAGVGREDSPGVTSALAGGHAGAAAAAGPGPHPGEHMLPLQHLLMSERAQHLSALEVKAIVYKVSTDLADLHDAGILHRHVTIASVALSRSGNLATARLMGHPYNVEAGPGRRYTGGKKAGVDAYLAPELARCPADCVAYTPAGDMWSLGVVLFVLLSGSHVPFGNRGLCWTCVPNMPGPSESVDTLQRWLEDHLVCKLGIINQLRESQEKGKAPLGASPAMRVVGLDHAACDLLLRLLAADPAARPTARQVLQHPWLAEVEGLIPSPTGPGPRAPAAPAHNPLPHAPSAPSPCFQDKLRRTASGLAHLGFSPTTPHEGAAEAAGARRLLRRESIVSVASTDSALDWTAASAAASHPSLAVPPNQAGGVTGSADAWLAAAAASESVHSHPQPDQQAAPEQGGNALHAPVAPPSAAAGSLVLGDGTSLQLLPAEAAAALTAAGLLPAPSSVHSAGYRTLGYAVQPVEVEVEGRRVRVCALHAVFDVDGQPMLCAQPVAIAHPQQLEACCASVAAAQAAGPTPPASTAPTPPAPPAPPVPGSNPDHGTSAPILPMLARMLQQQHRC